MRRTAGLRRVFRFAPFLLLAAENLVVFHRHYFGGYGFPWDFVGTYYAAAAYWTEAVSRGGLSMWMPFQSMGYPFLINLQTGLWYPPMWVFPLFRIPYTLHAAVVLQCLHVLAGALGMYALLRATVRSRREALLGAFAFQLFGGFYSNAEHVDIVRSFAMLPWLFWTAVPPAAGDERIPRRLVLAPVLVFLLAVGGYPGNLLAAMFLLALLAAFVLVQRRFDRAAVKWAASLGASIALGLLMAAIQLGPAWIYRAELIRFADTTWMRRAWLSSAHLPGLLLEPAGMPGDVSMISTYVGLPVLLGVALLSRSSLRRFWPWAALGLLAAAMAAGDSLPVHRLIRTLLPPLAYSRFPPSDYRGVFAVVLVILAAAGWRDVRCRRRAGSARTLTWRLIPVALFAAWSIDRVYARRPFWPLEALSAAVFVATAASVLAWRGSRRSPVRGLLAMLAAIAFGGALVLPRVEGWVVPDFIAVCRVFSPTPARMHDAGVVVDPAMFAPPPGSRPARVEGDGPYKASGYLTGSYVLEDFGNTILRGRTVVTRNKPLLGYMRREWTPILVEPPPPLRGDDVFVRGLLRRTPLAAPDPRVRQTSYGIDHVRYHVATDRPLLLVENEIYFPGWRARAGSAALEAVRVNESLRGWLLPAGTYELETDFRVPHLRLFALATAAAWVAWLSLAVGVRRRARRV